MACFRINSQYIAHKTNHLAAIAEKYVNILVDIFFAKSYTIFSLYRDNLILQYTRSLFFQFKYH